MNAFTDRALAQGQYPFSPGYKEGGTSKDAARLPRRSSRWDCETKARQTTFMAQLSLPRTRSRSAQETLQLQ